MTYSSYDKAFKQLKVKPAKMQKFIKHNSPKPRKFGRATRRCKLCLKIGAHIRLYGIDLCRQCFRLNAKNIGFKKYS